MPMTSIDALAMDLVLLQCTKAARVYENPARARLPDLPLADGTKSPGGAAAATLHPADRSGRQPACPSALSPNMISPFATPSRICFRRSCAARFVLVCARDRDLYRAVGRDRLGLFECETLR